MSERPMDTKVEAVDSSFVEVVKTPPASIAGLNENAEASAAAQQATDAEHQLTAWQSIKLYPRAILFSVILSFALIMEGYDTALLTNFYGLPQFRQRFGVELADGTWQITANWQTGLQNGANVGQIIGLLTAGIITDRYGYKKTMIGFLMFINAPIFLLFFAKNIGMLLAGTIICGIPLGAFQTLTTTYAADVTPIALRPILTSFVNLCWVFGQFIAVGVLRGILSRPDQWAWRIPYSLQWMWPVPIIVGIFFAPESPWWYVRHGQISQSRVALRYLASSEVSDDSINKTLQLMIVTNEHERQVEEGTTYLECFKGTNRRRTETACFAWIIQVTCGVWFGGSVVYFLQQVGFDPVQSFSFGVGTGGIAVVGTVSSWFLMPRIGRRKLYIGGLAVMFTCLLVVGFLGIPPPGSTSLAWASAGVLLVFVVTYQGTIGPVCYCLVSELPSTRLRVKTAVLARNAYLVASICANFLNPPILNPLAWHLRGRGGFIWAATCLCSLVWTYFRLPEPKGRTPAELDILFEQKIRARHFKKAKVELFRQDGPLVVT